MVVDGNLHKIFTARHFFECSSCYGLKLSYGSGDGRYFGGTLFLNKGKLGCAFINGYIDNNILDFSRVERELFEEEQLGAISYVYKVGQNNGEHQYTIIFFTDLETKVEARVNITPTSNLTGALFTMEIVDFVLKREERAYNTPSISNKSFLSGYYFNNKTIRIQVDGETRPDVVFNKAQEYNIIAKINNIIRTGKNLPILINKLSTQKANFTGWGGEGGIKPIKDEKTGEVIYDYQQGRTRGTQIHNNFLDVGTWANGTRFGLYKTIQNNPSVITDTLEDGVEPFYNFTSLERLYDACVFGGGKYALIPPQVTIDDENFGFAWVK